jgi:hypothetical protein
MKASKLNQLIKLRAIGVQSCVLSGGEVTEVTFFPAEPRKPQMAPSVQVEETKQAKDDAILQRLFRSA